jgi:hypothetical protein
MLLTSLNCIGQNHSLGFYFAPSQTYRSLKNQLDRADRQEEDAPVVNFGIDFRTRLTKRATFRTGIGMSTLGYDWMILDSVALKYRYHYIDVPLGIEIALVWRSKLRAGIGFSLDLHYLYKAEMKEPKKYRYISSGDNIITPSGFKYTGKELRDRYYQIFNQSAVVSLPIIYKVLPQMNIGLSPSFRYMLQATIQEDKHEEHLYSYGLNFHVMYSF